MRLGLGLDVCGEDSRSGALLWIQFLWLDNAQIWGLCLDMIVEWFCFVLIHHSHKVASSDVYVL